MEAEILPLDGKYYGTVIKYKNTFGEERTIKVWNMGDYTPSQRQLEKWGYTLDEAKEDGMMCDDHFESAECHKIASVICRALNENMDWVDEKKMDEFIRCRILTMMMRKNEENDE